jgi:RHS repeat-associated protein
VAQCFCISVRWCLCFRCIILALFLPGVLALTTLPARGQGSLPDGQVLNGETAKPIPGGHDYIHLAAETVNPSNGSVSIKFNYPMPKGRGITLPFAPEFNTAGLYHVALNLTTQLGTVTMVPNVTNVGIYPTATWSMSSFTPPPVTCPPSCPAPNPWGVCHTANGFNFTDQYGTSHNLGLAVMANAQNYTNSTYCEPVGNASAGVAIPSSSQSPPPGNGDGQVWAIWTSPSQTVTDVENFQGGVVGPFTVTDKEGTTYFFGGGGTYDSIRGVYTATPYQIEDRNGNLITSNIDTLGRQMTSGTTIGGLTYPAGTCPSCPSSTTVSYTPTSTYGVVATLISGETLSCPPYNLQVNSAQAAATVFALPTSTQSNPQQYTLYNGNYNPNDSTLANPYGLVNELVYPDGGWVKYTWKMSNSDPNNPYAQSAFFTGNGMYNGVADGKTYPQGCALKYNTPVLATRTVSFDGVTVAQTETFTYQTTWSGWGWTSKQTSVVTTDNVSGNSFLAVYNYGAGLVPGSDPLTWGVAHVASGVPVETSILYYSGNSTSTPLLRTVTKSWYDVFDPMEVDTTENGLTSKVVFCYVGASCNPSTSLTSPFYLLQSKSDYDFTGSLVRTTNYQYKAFSSNTITYSSNSVTLPVPSRPSSVTVKNSSGTVVAETDYSYDGASLGSSTGVQHDDSNYGASLTNRGNATSVTHKCIGCTNAVTTYTYDITGQPASMTDPCGNTTCTDMSGSTNHTTTYSFLDSPTGGNAAGQSNAYLTQVTYPPTGNTVHQENFQYNYVFGDLTLSKDQNGQATNYTYETGAFDRLIVSAFPIGQTDIVYGDSPTSPSVTTCQLITGSAGAACSATSPPSGWKVSNSLFDGVFHTKQTQLVSDPDGEDFVDITYDGLGRKRTASNPHRSASSSTDGTATTSYDVLGRPILVTEQDGSTVQTAYDQTCALNTNTLGTLVTDEAGNQRRSCTDGLGRLVEVDEPGGSVSGSAEPGSGSVTIAGSEEGPVNSCPPNNCPIYDSGNFTVTVNGMGVGGAGYSYGGTDTPSTIAAALATAINNDSSSPVTASASGGTVSVISKTTGSSTDYSLAVSMSSNTTFFPTPSFTISPSGTDLTGGMNAGLNLSTPFVTLYNYDTLGNLICVEQHGSATNGSGCSSAPSGDPTNPWRIRRFTYDSLSRLLTAENPETGFLAGLITYTYDANSNLLSKKTLSPNQGLTGTATVTTSYTYDPDNRLTGKSYMDTYTGNPATPPVLYGYDGSALTTCVKTPPSLTDTYPKPHRTSMCDGSSTVPGSGSASWSHDQMGRVLIDKRFIGSVSSAQTVTYTYNADGSTHTVATPDGKTVTYVVGAAGRPQSAVDNSGNNYVTSATYAPPGELQTLTNGASIHGALAYNPRLQPMQMFYGTNTPPAITSMTAACPSLVGNIMNKTYSFSLGAGDNGNVVSIANCRDTTRTQSFTYDALNRIESAQSNGTQWGETFTIDAWGNLTNETGITGKTNHEGLNTSAGPGNQLVGFGYDPAGNMTGNGGTTYVYDAENRLVWTTGGYRYIYDGDGNRVEKCVAGSATTACPTSGTNGTLYWMGGGSAALDESDLSGNMLEQYVFFGGARVARRDVSPSAVHYYFSDQVGSHSVVENATGTVSEQDIDYYPYGGQENDYSPNVTQHYKFNGKERDTESGLDNFGARFDASNLGRFMTPDWAAKPIAVPYANFGNPQSLNLYAYVENNPATLGDPDGHGADCTGNNWLSCAAPKVAEANADQEWVEGGPPSPGRQQEQAKAQNTTPVPTSLHVESATDMTRSNPAMNYGIFIDVKYQVLDQNGKPIQSDKMQPMENGTFGNGDKYSGPIVSNKADENHTQADGTFHDKPVGDVHPRQPTDPIKIQQNITIVMGDKEYKVRTQTYTVTSGGYGKGRIVNDSGDIDVTRP